jgi:4-amino-4-deoxy-L-arabinose transferase-like glycosyltransferase
MANAVISVEPWLPTLLSRVLFTPWRLMLATTLWLAAFAWLRPLALPDEGRYTDISRWMSVSGDWLVPRIDGLPFLHKPPLYYWLEAMAIGTFGASMLVARLVPLASATIICVCVFWLVRRFADEQAARWSVAVLALNPLFYGGAQFANLDMLVAAMITLTITLAVLAARGQGRLLWLAAYGAAALAVLAKGLIGVVLPGAVFVLWALLARRPDWMLKALSIVGIILFIAIALPWFYAVESTIPGFVRYFVVYHHFERFLAAGFNNQQGPWFYPAVLFVAMLPWTVASLPRWRSFYRERAFGPTLQNLGAIWFTVVLAFFSAPRSKLVGYILPALPAFALLIGPWMAQYSRRRVTATIGAAICIVAALVAAFTQQSGPVHAAAQVKSEMKSTDDVVFIGRYFFDVAVVLDRRRPIYIVGDWSQPSTEIPDNLRRQLTEGREFDPQAGYVLLGHARLEPLLQSERTTWVVAERQELVGVPGLNKLTTVATERNFVVLRKNGT